jgi:hypothetical protein
MSVVSDTINRVVMKKQWDVETMVFQYLNTYREQANIKNLFFRKYENIQFFRCDK